MNEEQAKILAETAAVHSRDKYPLQLGTVPQQSKLLEDLDLIRSHKPMPNIIYDDLISYFEENNAGYKILTGLEAEDRTPVGGVTQRAPLDITSVFYPVGLGVQAIEEAWKLMKLASSDPKPDGKLKNYIEYYLPKEAEAEIAKRHAPRPEESYTGKIEYIGPDGRTYTIKQWRDPKNIPECCLGGKPEEAPAPYVPYTDRYIGGMPLHPYGSRTIVARDAPDLSGFRKVWKEATEYGG